MLSDWTKMNPYHMKQGDWTITKASNVPKPYGLYQGNTNHGHFKTSKEAMDRHDELNREAA